MYKWLIDGQIEVTSQGNFSPFSVSHPEIKPLLEKARGARGHTVGTNPMVVDLDIAIRTVFKGKNIELNNQIHELEEAPSGVVW